MCGWVCCHAGVEFAHGQAQRLDFGGHAVGAAARAGRGVHRPLSPYAPLKAGAGVLTWSVLTDVKAVGVP